MMLHGLGDNRETLGYHFGFYFNQNDFQVYHIFTFLINFYVFLKKYIYWLNLMKNIRKYCENVHFLDEKNDLFSSS